MKKLKHFHIRIKYLPERELVSTKVISRLMARNQEGTNALDKDRTLLYAGDIDKDQPPGTSLKNTKHGRIEPRKI